MTIATEQLLSPSGSICVGHIAVSRPSLARKPRQAERMELQFPME